MKPIKLHDHHQSSHKLLLKPNVQPSCLSVETHLIINYLWSLISLQHCQSVMLNVFPYLIQWFSTITPEEGTYFNRTFDSVEPKAWLMLHLWVIFCFQASLQLLEISGHDRNRDDAEAQSRRRKRRERRAALNTPDNRGGRGDFRPLKQPHPQQYLLHIYFIYQTLHMTEAAKSSAGRR